MLIRRESGRFGVLAPFAAPAGEGSGLLGTPVAASVGGLFHFAALNAL
jgi:hypothetical protein